MTATDTLRTEMRERLAEVIRQAQDGPRRNGGDTPTSGDYRSADAVMSVMDEEVARLLAAARVSEQTDWPAYARLHIAAMGGDPDALEQMRKHAMWEEPT